jgi:hypothetical protein
MLVALNGLGCHHKPCDSPCAPVFPCVDRSLYAIEYSTFVEPSVYSPCRGPGATCVRQGRALDGWGPAAGGYVGCYAGGATGCGCGRFPRH